MGSDVPLTNLVILDTASKNFISPANNVWSVHFTTAGRNGYVFS